MSPERKCPCLRLAHAVSYVSPSLIPILTTRFILGLRRVGNMQDTEDAQIPTIGTMAFAEVIPIPDLCSDTGLGDIELVELVRES